MSGIRVGIADGSLSFQRVERQAEVDLYYRTSCPYHGFCSYGTDVKAEEKDLDSENKMDYGVIWDKRVVHSLTVESRRGGINPKFHVRIMIRGAYHTPYYCYWTGRMRATKSIIDCLPYECCAFYPSVDLKDSCRLALIIHTVRSPLNRSAIIGNCPSELTNQIGNYSRPRASSWLQSFPTPPHFLGHPKCRIYVVALFAEYLYVESPGGPS